MVRTHSVLRALLVAGVLSSAPIVPEVLAAQSEAPEPASPVQPSRALYLELFGNGIYGSINYEMRLSSSVWARVGVIPFGPAMLVMANYLHGDGPHKLETGAGLTLWSAGDGALGTATLGYRFQPRTESVFFRLAFTPLFWGDGAGPWGGAAIGVSF